MKRGCVLYLCSVKLRDYMAAVEFTQVVSRGCGMDIHKEVVVATVRGDGIQKETRSFDSFTSSLTELREWLVSLGITHVAMESTGVYWKPIYNVFEGHIPHVWIVNARHIKNVPGHKTDKNDSEWICQLLMAGRARLKRSVGTISGASYRNSYMRYPSSRRKISLLSIN